VQEPHPEERVMNLPLLAGCIAGAFVVPAVYSLAKLARI
jgi:hypothetical protein